MDGFTVDFAALQAVNVRLRTAAADLDTVTTAWASAAADGGSQFGTAECTTAFTELYQDLSTRLKTHKANLDDLTTTVGDTARSYFTVDGSIADSYGKAAS